MVMEHFLIGLFTSLILVSSLPKQTSPFQSLQSLHHCRGLSFECYQRPIFQPSLKTSLNHRISSLSRSWSLGLHSFEGRVTRSRSPVREGIFVPSNSKISGDSPSSLYCYALLQQASLGAVALLLRSKSMTRSSELRAIRVVQRKSTRQLFVLPLRDAR